MARVFRLIRLLFAYKAFEMVGIISVDILPAAANVVLILLFLMYFFAALGTILYGGRTCTVLMVVFYACLS